jgi:Fur family zinc uptake transcriptional regulator
MSDLDTVVAKARSDCSSVGQRLTDKRERVLRILLETGAPLSAYDILERYQKAYGTSMPAMSVYRMLQFLEKNKLVHKLETTNQYLACVHIRCDHEHSSAQFLICDSCQYVKEIVLSKAVVNELGECVSQSGFTLTNSQIELRGLCADCSK